MEVCPRAFHIPRVGYQTAPEARFRSRAVYLWLGISEILPQPHDLQVLTDQFDVGLLEARE